MISTGEIRVWNDICEFAIIPQIVESILGEEARKIAASGVVHFIHFVKRTRNAH
jgi:hypothetical protein